MAEPERKLYFDTRLEMYEGYIPEEWAAKLAATITNGSALDRLFFDLLVVWRTTAYTAAWPAVLAKSIQAFTVAYAGFVSPDSSIVSFADAVVAKVSRKVPELVDDRNLRGRIVAELATIADDIRRARSAATPEIPVAKVWEDWLKEPVFAMSVWSSQRVAYVSFYNAYEAFLVQCAKTLLGTSSLRTTDKEFKQVFREALGRDILHDCWTHPQINIARLVRHALSHAAGRETPELKAQQHGVVLIDGVLQIAPCDNHRMLGHLRAGVDALVSVAVSHPAFR